MITHPSRILFTTPSASTGSKRVLLTANSHPNLLPRFPPYASESWLELWWEESCAKNSPEATERMGLVSFKLDSWLMLVGMLCKLTGNNNLEVSERYSLLSFGLNMLNTSNALTKRGTSGTTADAGVGEGSAFG